MISGIKDFDGRGTEPIGAALSVGCKGENGAPTDKDRFYVVNPAARKGQFTSQGGKTYSSLMRDPHPSFDAFNFSAHPSMLQREIDGKPNEHYSPSKHAQQLAKRQVIPISLAHLTIDEAYHGSYFALKLPGFAERPGKAPCCVGNGEHAERWIKGAIQPIPCPGEQCPFRQKGEANGRPVKAPCGPRLTLFARFNWPRVIDPKDGVAKGLPNLPFKFTSGSVFTYLNFAGFWRSFRRACDGFGVRPDDVPLFGFPAQLMLQERTNAEAQTAFPVVSIAPLGDGDILGWIAAQIQRGSDIRRIAESARVPALTDRRILDATLADDQDLVAGPQGVP